MKNKLKTILNIGKCDMYSDNSHHIQIKFNSCWLIGAIGWNFYNNKAILRYYGENALMKDICFSNKIKQEEVLQYLISILFRLIKKECQKNIIMNWEFNEKLNIQELIIKFEEKDILELIYKNKWNPLNIAKLIDEVNHQ